MSYIKIPLIRNKKNGQINSYFKREQLPQKIRDAIKAQPHSLKSLLIKIKGVE
jgi:hypothetical protein